jgi:predicted 2-oxoglutarate/Fe(II)-dependent dioxygenase YbiX
VSIYVLTGLLSPGECLSAAALFPEPRPAEVVAPGGAIRSNPVRRGRASHLSPDGGAGNALRAKIWLAMLRANAVTGGFDLKTVEPLQLAEYAVGDGYDWHLDIGPGTADLRKLSASVQLSDPAEYDGGDLEIWGTGGVDRARGTIIAFPSYIPHRVTAVTRGVRRALVAWAAGDAPFR